MKLQKARNPASKEAVSMSRYPENTPKIPNIDEIIEAAPQNRLIQFTMMKMNLKLFFALNPVCSVSGGSDSDTMLDIIERVRCGRKVTYVFFDTGIEYAATLRHLDDLEAKYGVEIVRRKATVPVPLGCKHYGLPFFSKRVSQDIDRLQKHGFQWEDEPFEVLLERYPHCKSSLKWWCNAWVLDNGKESKYNIKTKKYLKEFMMEHPPDFEISDKCCQGAKKDTGEKFDVDFDVGMKILGLRRAEGGVRATAYTSCFSVDADGMSNYRPLWFWSDEDKAEYKEFYGLTYSDCYEVWGFRRTGCAGCPFNSRFEDEVATMEQYEPKLAAAVKNIFGPSYEYTRAYRKYKAARMAQDKLKGQTTLDEAVNAQNDELESEDEDNEI